MESMNEYELRERRQLRERAREMIRRRCGTVAPVHSLPDELRTESGFCAVSMQKLMTEPVRPVDWLWQDRLVVGTVSLLVGKPKVGRSTMARHIACSVASGKPLLGGRVIKGMVVYLALEERIEDVKSNFAALGVADGDHLFIAAAANIDDVNAIVHMHRPALVVVDPLARFVQMKNGGDYFETYRSLGPLIDLARQTGTHILGPHHEPRNRRSDPIDSPIGGVAFGGAPSTILFLRRAGDERTLQSRQRIGRDMPETVLRFDDVAKQFSLGPTLAEVTASALEQEILGAIGEGIELTEPAIRTQVTGRTTGKNKQLRKLVAEGKVTREGTGRRGDPYRYRDSRFLVPKSKKK